MAEFAQQLINGISWGSIYALIALGYTMVYGVLQLINFAHGDVYMVGAMAGYYSAHGLGIARNSSLLGAGLVLILSMLTCGILGFLIERFAYRPLRGKPRLTVLITAIGVSLLLENAGQLIFGADPKFFPSLIPTSIVLSFGEITVTNIQLGILAVALLLMIGLRFVVQRTRVGTAMRAVAFSPSAASLMGINVDRIISVTFVMGSALAAAAGVLVGMSNPKIEPLMGIMPGLKAFVAAVLGGIGNLTGAMVGGLLMGIIETLVVGYLSSTYRDAIAFVLLIAILLIRPSGLFGQPVSQKA
jgi:branched-chain amino acid transport system permease protein